MAQLHLLICCAAMTTCGRFSYGDAPPGDAAPGDAAQVIPCSQQWSPFSIPVPFYDLPGEATWLGHMAADELTLFTSPWTASALDDVSMATRVGVTDPFPAVMPVDELNTNDRDVAGSLSMDGLELYFTSARPGGSGMEDLWVATRISPVAPFSSVTDLSNLNSPVFDEHPSLADGDLTLYFSSNRNGGSDIWRATRTTRLAAFSGPAPVDEVNALAADEMPRVSADGLELFLVSNRAGAAGDKDIWRSTRSGPGASWSTPAPVIELNTMFQEINLSPNSDGTRLYLNFDTHDDGSRGSVIHVATRQRRCANAWQGEDLTSGLVAYWPFDEGTSTIATDAAGSREARLVATDPNSAWVTGVTGSALEFGANLQHVLLPWDAALTPPVATISMWVKTPGAAGEVQLMVSGASSTPRWVFALDDNQILFTPDSGAQPVNKSHLAFTDDAWHHVVVVSIDATPTNVLIYIDGGPAPSFVHAETYVSLCTEVAIGGGCGAYTLQGSLDEVRLYNRALTPAEVNALYRREL